MQEGTLPEASAKGTPPYVTVHKYLHQADERLAFRALPRQIADAPGLELRPVLEALVGAMSDGDAAPHWEIVCPACSARGEQHDWLHHAQPDVACKNCQATFAVHLDKADSP